jgi:hypothetical protein
MAHRQSNSNTKQMEQTRDEKGRITGGTPPAGFNVNPQNRHNGAWKKEDTPRYKLEQMMKLPEPDLRKIAEDKDAPLFERKLATAIAKGQWREIKEMIEQVYGKPKESVDVTSGGETIKALVQFVDENDQDKTS